jgi:predicted DCC family thiol-disulfide oxidoreductase YuxK
MSNEPADTALLNALKQQPVLLFDGECGFCNKTVRFFLRHEKKTKDMRFAPLESDIGKALRAHFNISPETDSIILIRDHSAHIKSRAAILLSGYMRGGWGIARVLLLVPRVIRDAVYDFIARRRKKLAGRVESCAMLSREDQTRFLTFQ